MPSTIDAKASPSFGYDTKKAERSHFGLSVPSPIEQAVHLVPGLLLAALITAASFYITKSFGGPVMLYALVLGALCNPLGAKTSFEHGVTFSADTILKIGVALLGVKITVLDVAHLGFQTAGLVVVGVIFTLCAGTLVGRLFGLSKENSILSSGAVAICGCSAALAISAVLPQNKSSQCNLIVAVISVTFLSTLAMVSYPLLASALNLSDTQAGIFMGVTIHNVAQVVGAGYIVSDTAGDIATVVKLMRVACLVPVIVIIGIMYGSKTDTSTQLDKRPALLPMFMIGFIIIMLINSIGLIPASLNGIMAEVSKWALAMSVAALGLKTSFKDIIHIGIKPVFVMTVQTALLAVFAAVALLWVLPI